MSPKHQVSPLNEIALHHFIKTMEKQFDVCEGAFPDPDDIDRKFIRPLLAVHPIPVVERRNRFLCIGNVTLFRWAHFLLRSDESIPVMIISRNLRREDIVGIYWLERLSFPAMFSLNGDEIRQLFEFWSRIRAGEIPVGDVASFSLSKSAFARVMRVSRQSLGEKR